MFKKAIVLLFIISVVLLSFSAFYRYNQYILAWQANQHINVSGIKLMMEEYEVKGLIGKEEAYMPGFGGYRIEYPSKGIFLSFLDDRDTDFYKKVNEIVITDSQHEIYGIKVGDEFNKSVNNIYKYGFAVKKEGYQGYWQKNMYIRLDKEYDKVHRITIGIRDRVSSSRIY